MSSLRFEVVDGDQGYLEQIYKLLYRVYVLDYNMKAGNEQECENDRYDKQSMHIAAINSDDQVVGTIRLIKDGTEGLPVYNTYGYSKELVKPGTVELSRLAVDRRFCAPDPVTGKRLRFRDVTTGLYRSALGNSLKEGFNYWIAAMEPKRMAVIDSFCKAFVKVSDEIQYSDTVKAFIYECSVQEVLESVRKLRDELDPTK